MREQPSWSYLPEEYVDPSAPTDYGRGRRCTGTECSSGPDGTRGTVSRYQIPEENGEVLCFHCQERQIDGQFTEALAAAARKEERERELAERRREVRRLLLRQKKERRGRHSAKFRGQLLPGLRRLRQQAGHSQAQLGEIAGVSSSMVGQCEKLLTGASEEIQAKIAAALGVEPEDLRGEKEAA